MRSLAVPIIEKICHTLESFFLIFNKRIKNIKTTTITITNKFYIFYFAFSFTNV